MDDALEMLIGLVLCGVPFLLIIGGIVAIVRSSRSNRERARLDDLETHIEMLRGENRTLRARLSRVEGKVAEMNVPALGPPMAPSAALEPTEAEDRPTEVEIAPAAAGAVEPAVAPMAAFVAADATVAETPEATTAELPAELAPDLAARATETETAIEAPAIEAPAIGAPATGAPTEAAPQASAETAPAPAPVAPTPPPPPSKIDWEQWIGVRGAAALGASILVLAGIYFFEYSIEHGLITPAMRMVAGTLVGLGCVLASELRLRKTHTVLANWIAGAGIGILYVAFWAGNSLYDLYPTWAAGLLLVATTGACVTLAVRRDSAAIAVLGLFGGFATPLALSTGADRPIPLFGYVLLLDGAMLWVAYKRRWPWMALLCLLATAAYQHSWLLARLDEPRLVLGVAIVAVFAILFAALPSRPDRDDGEESPLWKLSRSAGVLVPLLFTVPLAVRQDLGQTFWATAAQLVLLCVAALWVGRRHRSAMLPTSAALIASGTLLGWAVSHPPHESGAVWKLVGLALVIAAVFHGFAELERYRKTGTLAFAPSAVFALAALSIAALAAPWIDGAGPWPWLALWAVLSILVARLAGEGESAKLPLAAAVLSAIGLGSTFAVQVGAEGQPGAGVFLGLVVGAAVLMQIGGLLPRSVESRRWADHSAAIFALILVPLLSFAHDDVLVPTWAFYASTLLLGGLTLLAASRLKSSGWMLGALLTLAVAHGAWIARRAGGPFDLLELTALGVAVIMFSFFPVIAPKRMREQPWAWRTAALAGPAYLLAMRHVYLDVIGAGSIGALPVVLAMISIGAASAVRARGPESAEAQKTALVWLTATAAGFVTLAIPLQLSNEWITIGWAAEGLVLTFLWRRFDHAGLKYLAFALAGVVCVRLMANPYVLGYYPRSELRILNWLSYTYLVPAACLMGMWALLRGLEIERRRSWEKPLFPEKHALMANVAITAAIGVVFVWLNLTIFDWFASGPELTIPMDRLPARDLTLSIAWAIYALGLLAIGMWRESTALRATSLALVLITAGKVFLYDLAHLADLYRVASLVGLALSLIVISLAYQRFVFRAGAKKPEEAR